MKRRFVLGSLCLVAGLSYRVNTLLPSLTFERVFLLALSALFLLIVVLTRRSPILSRYWEIPFAFFVFTLVGDVDLTVTPEFVANVLREAPSTRNPLASTVQGTVLAQIVSTLSITVPIILLTKASGYTLSSIYIDKERIWKGLLAGIIGFVVFYLSTALGLFQTFFPNNGVTLPRFLALTPPLIILVLSNGFREELWFRGTFLKKYGRFLGPSLSNIIQASVFTLFHLQVRYTSSLLLFLGITFILGLWLGYLMQRSGSFLGPTLFHAGADIPILLAFLSYASP